MKWVGKKHFLGTILDPKDENLVIHVVSLAIFDINRNHFLGNAERVCLQVDETSIIVSFQYSQLAVPDFSPELAANVSEYIEINNHAINFIDNKE